MAAPFGMTDEQWNTIVNGARAGKEQLAQTGTINGKTPNQNLAAVIQQPGNTTTTKAQPYITPNGTTDYHITGQPDTAYSPPAGGGGAPAPDKPALPQGQQPASAMNQAMSQMPTYVSPASSGLNFDQATSQVRGQLDPMFARALEALQAQKHQDQLNGDELGMAHGGAHSGLAADLQNKVAIGAAGKAADLDATRQTQIAQMAQDLVNRGQDNDFRNQQQKLAEYLGINGLNLQQQGQQADYTGIYKGLQTLQSQNQGFNQNMQTNQYNQGVKNDTFNQNLQTQQLNRNNFESDRSYELAKSTQNWTQTFQKEQYSDQKAQQLWENTFKTKDFEQSMKDAAASRGLQWAGLTQRDKEFVADQTFKEKAFKADQDQRGIDNTLNQGKLDWEKDPANPSNITKTPASSFKDDPDFQSDAANMVKNPLAARTELRDNSDAYIKKYGIDGYNALISIVNK